MLVKFKKSLSMLLISRFWFSFQNCPVTFRLRCINTLRPKSSDFLVQKIMHEDLVWFKAFVRIADFSCVILWAKIVSVSPKLHATIDSTPSPLPKFEQPTTMFSTHLGNPEIWLKTYKVLKSHQIRISAIYL